ncbi:MAG: hypothetical protein ACTHPS_01590 [Streptosporangiaceae bacterium]
MAEPSLIGAYLAKLSAQLPAPIVAELADGLEQTHLHYLGQGLGPDAAAKAALAEFGEARVIVAAFTRASPARRAARGLLATGPVVGACWGTALIINRAWAWPVPVGARVVVGAALITVIALLGAAAFGRHYRSAGRAAAAGCIGLTVLDATMLITITLADPVVMWPVIVGITASLARITFTTRTLRSVLAG